MVIRFIQLPRELHGEGCKSAPLAENTTDFQVRLLGSYTLSFMHAPDFHAVNCLLFKLH